MKNTISLVLLYLFCTSLTGQDIKSTAEIFKIMEESNLTYSLNIQEKDKPPINREYNLNLNQVYKSVSDDGVSIKSYTIDSTVKIVLDQAEKAFANGKPEKARKKYLEALQMDSSLFYLVTYIGQTYGMEGDWKNCIRYYKTSIALNPIDYMAHWFLADAYMSTGDKKKALKEITKAKILNRNNPRIDISLKTIFKANKLKWQEWEFNPQYQLDSVDEKTRQILASEDWMGYALAAAVWEFEPGYKDSMGYTPGTISPNYYKERILGMINMIDSKKKQKKYPEVKALKRALKQKLLDEYIYFEIILPEHPGVAYYLNPGFLDNVADYVVAIRGSKK